MKLIAAPPLMPTASPPPASTSPADIIRAQTELTRVRAEAGKAIVSVVFRSVVALGVFAMAIGASAVILQTAERELHFMMLAVIWASACIVGTVSLLSGLLERRFVHVRRLAGGRTVQLEIDDAEQLEHSFQE